MLLKQTFLLVINDDTYNVYDTNKITVINDGNYQGTLIFIIPRNTYQPNIEDYLITYIYYGSCSGCDTFLDIKGYTDDPNTEDQIKDYMTLALHLIQRMKILGEYE